MPRIICLRLSFFFKDLILGWPSASVKDLNLRFPWIKPEDLIKHSCPTVGRFDCKCLVVNK